MLRERNMCKRRHTVVGNFETLKSWDIAWGVERSTPPHSRDPICLLGRRCPCK